MTTWNAIYEEATGLLISIDSGVVVEEWEGLVVKPLSSLPDANKVQWDEKKLDFVPKPAPVAKPSRDAVLKTALAAATDVAGIKAALAAWLNGA